MGDDRKPCHTATLLPEPLLARCKAAGFEITRPLTTQPWGLRDFVVRDPAGHLIGIGERVSS